MSGKGVSSNRPRLNASPVALCFRCLTWSSVRGKRQYCTAHRQSGALRSLGRQCFIVSTDARLPATVMDLADPFGAANERGTALALVPVLTSA